MPTATEDRNCPWCGYEWEPRVEAPKRCPRCQRWLVPWEKQALPTPDVGRKEGT